MRETARPPTVRSPIRAGVPAPRGAPRGARTGSTCASSAAGCALHANTARWHLGVLADAGLVESRPGANGAPGRPRIIYALRPGVEQPAGRDEYRLLATLLTGAVASSTTASARARGRRAPGAATSCAARSRSRGSPTRQAKAEVVALLDEQGFATEPRHGDASTSRRCPFPELAESHPEIVCSAHRGLIDGAFAELGSDLRVEQLDVFVRPDLCVARLGRAAA